MRDRQSLRSRGCHDGPCEQALVKAGAPPRRMDGSQGGDQTPRDGGCEFITDPQDVELLERLGGGSFGVVYRATWRGTPVAAKCLRATVLICVAIKLPRRNHWLISTQAGNSEDEALALKDFHNEATVLFRLRHPNIATLLVTRRTARRY